MINVVYLYVESVTFVTQTASNPILNAVQIISVIFWK